MASPDRDLRNKAKINITTRGVMTATEVVLVAGGFIAGITGGYRAETEWGNDREAKGAITRGMELDPKYKRPSTQTLEESKTFVKDLVSGVNSESDTKQVYAAAGRILVSEDELERHYAVLSQEQKYQDTRDAFINAVDADNLDDRNIWTAVAGAAATGIGLTAAWGAKGRGATKEASDLSDE